MNKKFLVYLSAVLLFAFPALVFAMNDTSSSATSISNVSNYSEEELVALIKKLQNQLEEVRKNNVQCLLAEVDLSIGDGEGDDLKEYVKAFQNFLKEKGYLKANATGYFGKLTRTALINFQRDNSLEQTGALDSTARNSIKNLKCKKGFTIKEAVVKNLSKENKEMNSKISAVTSIALEATGNTVKWSATGASKNGFKIVWSRNPNPTYPTRYGDRYLYTTDMTASNATLEAFSGSGTYYARVCEYLGGVCGTYSNEVSTAL